MMYPKIELHVHLEGTVRAETLLEIARRNEYPLPADTVEGLAELYEYRDFEHFIEVWVLTTNALRTRDDFRQVVVDYAAEAASHGAVYIEGIFSPAERVRRGVRWEDIFGGYCDGARGGTGAARRRGSAHARHRARIPDGGVRAGRSLLRGARGPGGRRGRARRARGAVPAGALRGGVRAAKAEGLGSVPHAGEVAGPESVRGALEALQADRIRHGFRAIEDPGLVAELAERQIVLDVSPVSNVRTGAVRSLRRSIRCHASWRPACPARSPRTTRPCSTQT